MTITKTITIITTSWGTDNNGFNLVITAFKITKKTRITITIIIIAITIPITTIISWGTDNNGFTLVITAFKNSQVQHCPSGPGLGFQ